MSENDQARDEQSTTGAQKTDRKTLIIAVSIGLMLVLLVVLNMH